MPRIDAPRWTRVWALCLCVCVCNVQTQATAQVANSLATVDALLQAENQALVLRATSAASQISGQAIAQQAKPVSSELTLLSVYGFAPHLRIDVRFGDAVMTGLGAGQREGGIEVQSIEGVCARLVVTWHAGRQTLRPCWSPPAAVQPSSSVAKSESQQNMPLPSDIRWPSLPMAPNWAGLARAPSAPVMSQ